MEALGTALIMLSAVGLGAGPVMMFDSNTSYRSPAMIRVGALVTVAGIWMFIVGLSWAGA